MFETSNITTLNITIAKRIRARAGRLFLVLFVSVCSSNLLASDYKAGFSAYIEGDYSQAQQHWLNAAKNKDAKSMFNLGLLHEQNKIAGASSDKAISWFNLSMNNGYPAAAYHLAQRMLERGGSDEQAIALIKRAADQSYAPAMLYLGQDLADAQQSKASMYASKSSKATQPTNRVVKPAQLQSKQVNSDTAWINAQAEKNWTIQLLAFTQKDQVERFIKDNELNNTAYFFEPNVNGEVFYKLLYGSYDSKIQAEFARQNLPKSLTKHGPWLRTLASVHQVTKVER